MFITAALLAGTVASNAVTIDKGNYKIAYSADGNLHDPDDLVASPLALALMAEAGVANKLIHFDYNNHVYTQNHGGDTHYIARASASNPEMKAYDNKSDIYNGKGVHQKDFHNTSVRQACDKWGIPKDKTKNCLWNVSNAVSNLGNSMPTNMRTYYICAGPMEIPWRACNALSATKKSKITCISHSSWNNNHKHSNDGMSHTWSSLSDLGVATVSISDQNDASVFKDTRANWKWLKDKGGKYNWLYYRNSVKNLNTFDGSDAGMMFYVITGRKSAGQRASMADVKSILN